MIKMIATDVDGTLVKDGTLAISPEYYDTIQKLIDQGIKVVICSGRQYSSMTKLFTPIKDSLMYITDGGTVIRSPKEILKVWSFQDSLWKDMYRSSLALPACDCFIATPDKCYAEDAGSRMFSWLRDSYGFPMYQIDRMDKLTGEDVIKFSVYHHKDCESICKEEFIPMWQNKSEVTIAGKEWVDCIPKEASKGKAIAYLQELWGITPEETCVFGDNLNDITMLKQAKYSFAVANAREEVKAAANFICPGYQQNGVLQTLNKILSDNL